MKTRLLMASAAAVALAFALPAFAADSAQDFVDKAANGGMFEVESSKLATGKVQDQSVKDFAQKMISDHDGANAKLMTIAGEQKLKVPAELDAKHKSNLEALQKTEGSLDAPYISMQKDAHAEAVKLFESYSKDGDNAPLKAFAQETLPTLKKHQEMVDQIATTIDAKSAPTATTPDTAAAPVPGANSFTEDQAKSRIQDAGYSDVSGLAKDNEGIWRGQANKDGKSIAVALDYQGNIVAGTN